MDLKLRCTIRSQIKLKQALIDYLKTKPLTCCSIYLICDRAQGQQVTHQLESPFQVRFCTQAWQRSGPPCQPGAWHHSGLGAVWEEELELEGKWKAMKHLCMP